jgi:subtilisin family serine protease
MMVSFSRWVKAPVALAAAGVMAGVPPAAGGGVGHGEWWLRALHVRSAWATANGGRITVAVLDTGVDPAAPDLAGSVITGADFTRSERASTGGFWGVHGTAVASLIAGHGHGPGGADGIAGVAPRAKILPVRVVLERTDPLENNPAVASHQPAAIASGIRYAVRRGAEVIALPLDPGQPTVMHPAAPTAAGGSAAEKAAVAYAAARGVVLVAPAGDTGNRADRVNYPAAYPGVISVGAVGRTFAQAPFTSRRPYVTLTAPGQAIVAAIPGGGYTTFSSTSAASAIVAGIAALIKSRYRSLTAAQVKDALIHTTVARPRGARRNGAGFGTVAAAAALKLAANMAAARTPPPTHPSATAAAPHATAPTGHPITTAAQSTAILTLVILLIVLLGASLIAIGRLTAAPPGTPEQSPGGDAEMPPPYASAPWPPTPWPAGPATSPPSHSQAAYHRTTQPPARAAAFPPAPGDMAPAEHMGGQTTPFSQTPLEQTIRPPKAPGGPPWGPAPKPEGPSPPWAQPPN